jgi:hypothetical protein
MFEIYLKTYSICILFFVVALGLFNYAMDPYDQFRKAEDKNAFEIVTFRNRKDWARKTISRIDKNDCNTVFLGNSRVWLGLNPDHMKSSHRGYNAAYSNVNFENIYLICRSVLSQNNIDTLVLGVDFGMERMPNDLSATDNLKIGLVKGLWGFATTKYSFSVLKKKRLPSHQRICLPNGYRIAENNKWNGKNYSQHLSYIIKRYRFLGPSAMKDGKGWKYFKAVVDICRSKGVKLYIFISPVHAEILEGIVANGLYNEFEDWIRMVVDIAYGSAGKISDKFNPAVWMFCGYNYITTEPFPSGHEKREMKWYFDSSHYQEAVGNMILDRMFEQSARDIGKDFGVRLTPENVETSLKTMREDRKVYLGKKTGHGRSQ